MKIFLPFLLALLLVFTVPSCGGPSDGQSPASPPAPASSAPESGALSEEEPAAHDPVVFRLTQETSIRNEKFREEEFFAGFMAAAESTFLIPGLNEAMTPQGISWSEETGLAYISAYAIVDNPSAILAVDPQTGDYAAEYFLYQEDGSPFVSHVGGIAVVGDKIYLSAKLDNDGSYSVAELLLSELPTTGSHDITVSKTISLPVSPSFLNYSEGILWVGNFYYPKGDYDLSTGMAFTTPSADGDYGCYIVGYALEPGGEGLTVPEGEQYPIPSCVLAAPDRIQGFVRVGDTVWLSQSYGRTVNSTLLSYALPRLEEALLTIDVAGKEVPAYILDSRNQTAAVTAMPMTEGLCIGPEGSVLVLFESGSARYRDGRFRTDRVWKMAP